MNDVLISIITVCYNASKSIERTIQSVINQTYNNIEYIIIDGGSTDGTVNIIKKYSERISFWSSEPDNGIYDAMNKGIMKATGQWLNFMNAGDTFVSVTTISYVYNFLYGNNFSIIYGNILRCHGKVKERVCGIKKESIDAVDFFQNTIHHQGSFIQKSLFCKYGLYNIKYRLAADWEFFMRVVGLYHEKVLYINHDIAYFMMDGVSSLGVEKYEAESTLIKECLFGEYAPFLQELSEFRNSSIICRALQIRLFLKKIGLGKLKKYYRFLLLYIKQ